MGAVTSICIDSTGRSEFKHSYGVRIISDCTAGRIGCEEIFYADTINPLYAEVIDSKTLSTAVVMVCQIRAHMEFSELPIIALTAHAMGGDVSKPINPDAMLKTLAEWTQRRS